MKKHVYLKFAGTLVLFALVGAALGFGTGKVLDSLGVAKVYDMGRQLSHLASQGAFWLLVANLAILAAGFFFWAQGRSLAVQALEREEDELYEKAEEVLCRSVILAAVSTVLGMAAFGMACCEMEVVLRSLPLFLLEEGAAVVLQHLSVSKVKVINPEKKGNVFETRFTREWYNSCDEAERGQIGWAAYQSYCFMQRVYAWAFVPLALLGCYGLVNPLVFVLWGGLWLGQTVSYSLNSRKAEKGKMY